MMKTAILASLLGSAAAFAPAPASKATTALNGEKSPAVPFLPYPENLKGYVGDDIGFDPLRISDYFPMDYLREAELKHSRICMLAVTGYIAVDTGFVIHPYGEGLSSAAAHDVMVEKGVMGNALVFLGLFEIVSYLGVAEMLQGSGREPGDFGFGTWYLEGKTEEQVKLIKYQEIQRESRKELSAMIFSLWRLSLLLTVLTTGSPDGEPSCSASEAGAGSCSKRGDALLQMATGQLKRDTAVVSEDAGVDSVSSEVLSSQVWLQSLLTDGVVGSASAEVSDDRQSARVSFSHEGTVLKYNLKAFSVYANDAELWVHTESGAKKQPIPGVDEGTPSTFKARDADNEHGQWASASIAPDGSVTGLFQVGGRVLRLEPLGEEHNTTALLQAAMSHDVDNPHLIQRLDISKLVAAAPAKRPASAMQQGASSADVPCVMVDGECVHDGGDDGKDGVDHFPRMDPNADEGPLISGAADWKGTKWWPGCYAGDSELYEFKVAVVLDHDGFQEHGSKAVKMLADLMAETSFVYEHQFHVKLSIGFQKIYESSSGAPGYAVGCSPVLKLGDFKGKAASDIPSGHGAAHLFTGCGTGYGTVGRAWIGTICRTDGYATGVNQFHKTKDWLIFAHELGHNFDGAHSFEDGQGKTGGIMDYGDGLLNGAYQFNTKYRKQKMCGKMKAVADNCNGGFKKAPPQGEWSVQSGPCKVDSQGCLSSPNYKEQNENSLLQQVPEKGAKCRDYGDQWDSLFGNRRRRACPEPTTTTPTTTTTTPYTDQYGNNEQCVIKVKENSRAIHVEHFEVMDGDSLTVNGMQFDSGNWEEMEGVVPRNEMTWKTDEEGTSTGFKLCPKGNGGGDGGEGQPNPTPAPPSAPTPSPSSPTPSPEGPAPPAGDARQWVNHHNYWRCIHGSPPIAWDVDFAKGAQEWADKGVFKHSDSYNIKPPQGPAGENLAAGSAGYMSIKKACDMWHDEEPEKGPKCGGHCTAMLWKAAKKLGCGINPKSQRGMLLVCRYGGNPVPNMGGRYEENVGFPDNSKEPECRKRYLEGGGPPAPSPPPPPPSSPSPPPPPAGSPSPPPPPGSPSPPGKFKELKKELKDLKQEIKQVEDAIGKAAR